MARTQSLGRRLTDNVLQQILRTHELASLEARLRLRNLQHKIIEYLWRPEGLLARRHLERTMYPVT